MLNIDSKKVVGVAFSSISSAQSTSFIIANSVMRLFLRRYESDQRREFGLLPELGFSCNELANDSQRQFYLREKFNHDNHLGCLISCVERFTPAAERLKVHCMHMAFLFLLILNVLISIWNNDHDNLLDRWATC